MPPAFLARSGSKDQKCFSMDSNDEDRSVDFSSFARLEAVVCKMMDIWTRLFKGRRNAKHDGKRLLRGFKECK